ncbi:DUF4124 domain-containing protein [Pelagibaculum spongiae]|uniref:DUF4124 domain-containing protein n=1 Tax=Pelagibaculum spongiae TaxID=2080658 RepID=A0A2V1GZA1_9GAMM|nr:DUF4124 domain-containing protein [Pelagibaculum spongiae]PVZ70284.1 hypothetical protein DC094_06710 [Pelagibaculum spongiae]
MKVLPIFALAIALLAANYSDAAEIYKWKDQDGKVVFGSSPPAGIEVERTGQQTGSGLAGEAIDAPNSVKEQLDSVNKSKKSRLKGKTLARHNERLRKRSAILCDQSKNRQNMLKHSPRAGSYDAKGNKRIYSTEERRLMTEQAQQEVNKYCAK